MSDERRYFGWTFGAWATGDDIDDVAKRLKNEVGAQHFKRVGHYVVEFFPPLKDGDEVQFSYHNGSMTYPDGYRTEIVELHRAKG